MIRRTQKWYGQHDGWPRWLWWMVRLFDGWICRCAFRSMLRLAEQDPAYAVAMARYTAEVVARIDPMPEERSRIGEVFAEQRIADELGMANK